MRMGLFEDFDSVTGKQWKHKIQYELNGADYSNTLNFETLEGIKLNPFYSVEHLKKDFDFPINTNTTQVSVSITFKTVSETNHQALLALQNGAEAIEFIIHKSFDSFGNLFNKIPEEIPIVINCVCQDSQFIEEICSFLQKSNRQIQVYYDPISKLATSGNWFKNQVIDFRNLAALLNPGSKSTTLFVDGTHYQNAGANCIQQVAYLVSHALEYFKYIKQNSLDFQRIIPTFKVAIGSHFIFEICKIKALRVLWKKVAQANGLSTNCRIVGIPSFRNKTLRDPHNNLVRTTVELMAGALGSVDMLQSIPYDTTFKHSNFESERLALNQLLILKKETDLFSGTDSVKGSYTIENLTYQLYQEAETICNAVSTGGGFVDALLNGTIQRKIRESASKEQGLFDQKKIIAVGTNAFVQNEPLENIQLEKPLFPTSKKNRTLIAPILPVRLSVLLEKEYCKKTDSTYQPVQRGY